MKKLPVIKHRISSFRVVRNGWAVYIIVGTAEKYVGSFDKVEGGVIFRCGLKENDVWYEFAAGAARLLYDDDNCHIIGLASTFVEAKSDFDNRVTDWNIDIDISEEVPYLTQYKLSL